MASSLLALAPGAQLISSFLAASARRAPVLPLGTARPRRNGGAIRASSSGTADENLIPESSGGADGYNQFSPVDANMMILRRRIECMRVKETFGQTPDAWMGWEKSCYNSYRADVNVLVASLQSALLGMRPGVVLFIVSFLMAAAPVACFLFLSAVSSQLYTLNNTLLDLLAPCSAATLPPI